MAESPTTPLDDASFSQHLLGEFLLQQGLISTEQLQEAQERLATTEAPDAIPLGPAYVPAADGKSILVVDPRKGTTETTIGLFAGDAGDGAETPTGWQRYSDGQILLLDDLETGPRRWLPTTHYPRLGLIPTPKGAYLYVGEEPRREYSPRLHVLPSPWLNPPGASGPLDLYPAPGGEYVVAANRGAGTIHVILSASHEQRGAISVRPAGHARGIGVAISPDARTIYVSDGLTPRLAVLDVTTFKVRHQLFPTGPLGSMVLNADGTQLLVCFTKGPTEMGLMTISVPDLRVRHLMNMPGKGEGERPNLPLLPSPDGQSAYLVTYSFETRDPHYLLQIDRAKHRVTKSFALREMPLVTAFPAPATWCPEPPDLGTVLMEMGLVSEDNLKFARNHLGGGEDAPLTLGNVPVNPSILAQLPERLIRDRGVIPLNQLDGQLVVAMGNPRDPRARQFVQDLAGELPVRVVAMTPAEYELFMDERYPKLMDQFFASQAGGGPTTSAAPPVPAEPRPAGGEGELTATIPAPGLAPEPPSGPPGSVAGPQPVPVAPRAMPGAARANARPPGAKAATALAHDDWGDLPGERFLLINPLKRQVAELDRTGKAAWLYSPEGDTLTRQFSGFVHAARLPSGNTLVVDSGANRVIEVNPAKEIVWQSLDDAKLKGPRHAVRLATGGTLVADGGNNRIVEIDPQGHAAWTYGEMGCSGNGLFKPNHVCVLTNGRLLIADAGNHRVIEVDPTKGVTWQYGNTANRLGGGQGSAANQLTEPASCSRLPNGNTLIVDAGNQRILEIDLLGAIVWTYKAGLATGGQAVKDPVLAHRLENGHTLVAGRQGVCEVDGDLRVVWEYHLLPPGGPSKAPAVRAAAEAATAAAPQAPAARVAAESDVPIQLPNRFLQADRMDHRVWEVDRQKQITWQYTGLGAAGSDRTQLDRPHHAKRLRNGNTLITDTGHHRIIEVTGQGAIVWEFGQFGKLGAGAKQLSNPRSAERLTNGDTLIADQSNRRVIEVSPAGEVVWALDAGALKLQAPTYATMLTTGNLLVVDWGGHVVYEVTPQGKPIWSYGELGRNGDGPNCLFHPERAFRLPNGNTLIADTQNHRVIEVTPAGEIAWQYGGDPRFLPKVGRFGLQYLTPIAAWRLANGHVVVQHAGKGHVVEVDRDLNVLFQFAP
jgi:DNA-binding beta-propeller fold protein YncE